MEVEIPFIREHKYKRPQAFERESNVSDSSNAVACSGKGSRPHFSPPLTKYKYWGEAEIPLIKKYNANDEEMRLIIKYKQR